MASGEYQYQTEFAKHHYGKGKAEGKAEAVLQVLAARGLRVSREARERILACHDTTRLDRWLAHAATAERVDDVIASPRPRRPAAPGLHARRRRAGRS